MTLLARDEQDIIAANIDFHLRKGVDFIIATDNLSVDRTRAILLEYQRLGVLHYIYEAGDDHSQHRWVTRMARMAHDDFGADWVINSDADEFWWPEHDADLKEALSAVPLSQSALAVERTNFIPRPQPEQQFFADLMTFREVRPLNSLGAPLPPKVCHRAYADVQVADGNHAVYRDGALLPTAPVPILILHFPLRSYAQFENKIAKGGAALARNSSLPLEIGATWRDLYRLYRNGGLRAYYEQMVLDEPSIQAGLTDGSIVRDDRLKRFLHAVRSQRVAGSTSH
jgi:hypothetical protein